MGVCTIHRDHVRVRRQHGQMRSLLLSRESGDQTQVFRLQEVPEDPSSHHTCPSSFLCIFKAQQLGSYFLMLNRNDSWLCSFKQLIYSLFQDLQPLSKQIWNLTIFLKRLSSLETLKQNKPKIKNPTYQIIRTKLAFWYIHWNVWCKGYICMCKVHFKHMFIDYILMYYLIGILTCWLIYRDDFVR